MTARELFDLIEGLPAEAKCEGLKYTEIRQGHKPHEKVWFEWTDSDHPGDLTDAMVTTVRRAAAMQRDAMTEWLHRKAQYLLPEYWHHGTHESWSITKDRRGESYPTRTHALAAAVRYVSGQAASSPSSS